MDTYQVSFHRLTLGIACLAAGALLAGGCGRRPAISKSQITEMVKKGAKKAVEKDVASVQVIGKGNSFTVDDAQGKRVLEAQVEKVDGTLKPGVGVEGPVKLLKVKCRLFRDGKPELNMESPEALWDGKQLFTEKTAHAVTVDGKAVMDSQKAAWTAKSGRLDLEQATVVSMKAGKADFTAEAPKAHVLQQVVTMPSGGVGRNSGGQRLSANHVRWHMGTEKVEANGNVVIEEEGTRVSGQRLVSDTRLKRGRLSGGTRIQMKKLPVTARNG